jgi:hypothetical protein
VDAVDYIRLKSHMGEMTSAGVEDGNFDFDDDVDWYDLDILQEAFGGSGGGSGPVVTPEPATLGLLALGAVAVLRRRRTV